DDDADEVIWLLAGIILAARVLGWLFNFIRQSVTARVVGDVVLALRTDAFDAVMERDLSFFDRNPSGKVVSRVTSDSDDFANVVTLTMNLLRRVLLVFIATGVLYNRNPSRATVALAMAPLAIVIALVFRKVARETTQRAQRSTARVNAAIQEAMNGIAIAKNFRQERSLYNDFQP